MSKSELESTFALQLRALSIPEATPEYCFHKIRRFRFDFAWPELKIAVEIDGGTWSGGRHTRGGGYHNDCIKNGLAVLDGWSVLRGDSTMVKDGTLINFLQELFTKRQVEARYPVEIEVI